MSGLLNVLPDKSRMWGDLTHEECEPMVKEGFIVRQQSNDPTKWNAKKVARHLYCAGKAYERKERYDFPGFIWFPIDKYTGTQAEMPFKYGCNPAYFHNMLLMQNGMAEWLRMKQRYLQMEPEHLRRRKEMFVKLKLDGYFPGKTYEEVAELSSEQLRALPRAQPRAQSRAQPSAQPIPNLIEVEVEPNMPELDDHQVDFPAVATTATATITATTTTTATTTSTAESPASPSAVPTATATVTTTTTTTATTAAPTASERVVAMIDQGFGPEDAQQLIDEARNEFLPTNVPRRPRNILTNEPRPIIRARPRIYPAIQNQSVSDRVAPLPFPWQVQDEQSFLTLERSLEEFNLDNSNASQHGGDENGANGIIPPAVPPNRPNGNDNPNPNSSGAFNTSMMDNYEYENNGLDENGLPSTRRTPIQTPTLDKSIAKLGKIRGTTKGGKKEPKYWHTSDPGPYILQQLKEWAESKWTDIDRPDFSKYYDNINRLLEDSDDEPVDILLYVDDYGSREKRFEALAALCKMASTGVITINTIREDDDQDSIRSFQIAE